MKNIEIPEDYAVSAHIIEADLLIRSCFLVWRVGLWGYPFTFPVSRLRLDKFVVVLLCYSFSSFYGGKLGTSMIFQHLILFYRSSV